eukprot:4762178-Pleurochrysis_carterae.AAC.1
MALPSLLIRCACCRVVCSTWMRMSWSGHRQSLHWDEPRLHRWPLPPLPLLPLGVVPRAF